MKNRMIAALAAALLAAAPLCGQDLVVSTNVLDYANFATLNVETGLAVARHWSLSAGAKYNPFTFGKGDGTILQRQQTYSVGARFWPWYIFSGWWICAKAQYQEFCSGGITSRRTSQGDRYGGSLSAGYTFMLSKHFNLEFGLGAWGGYEVYTAFNCQHCGQTVDSGSKYFLLPNDVTFALSYVF